MSIVGPNIWHTPPYHIFYSGAVEKNISIFLDHMKSKIKHKILKALWIQKNSNNEKIILPTYLSASDRLFLPHQFNIPEEWCAAFFTLPSFTPLCSLQCHNYSTSHDTAFLLYLVTLILRYAHTSINTHIHAHTHTHTSCLSESRSHTANLPSSAAEISLWADFA